MAFPVLSHQSIWRKVLEEVVLILQIKPGLSKPEIDTNLLSYNDNWPGSPLEA